MLFGRHAHVDGQRSFSLDTCLVIDRVATLAPIPIDVDSYTSDLLTDAVLSPLHTEGAIDDLTVYFGRRRSRDVAGPFSFFPARPGSNTMPLFARPQLSAAGPLQGVISAENMQGIKTTSGLSVADRDAIWQEVVRQVAQQDCGLGYHAEPPPVLGAPAADNLPGTLSWRSQLRTALRRPGDRSFRRRLVRLNRVQRSPIAATEGRTPARRDAPPRRGSSPPFRSGLTVRVRG